MRVERKEGILERAAKALDLPGEMVAGIPRVELVGDGQVRMAGHRGILSYGREEICVDGGKLMVRVRGEGLELRSMNPEELLITGRIAAVEPV